MMTTLNFFSLVSFISAHSYLPYLKKKNKKKRKYSLWNGSKAFTKDLKFLH